MNSNYRKNKALAIFNNTEPTKTDQSQAHETDINVIVKRYGIGGSAPGAPGQPVYMDWTQIPDNLREMIDMTRKLDGLRKQLPPQLADMPEEELFALRAEDLRRILTPPAPQPDNQQGSNP